MALETKKDIYVRPVPQPLWDGSPLEGRTLAILSEQGLGDTLQFVRYAKVVQDRGGKVVFECHKPLLKLVGMCRGIDSVGRPGVRCRHRRLRALLSLPRILGTTLENVPAEVPYLFADPELVETWRAETRQPGGPVSRSASTGKETKIQRGQVPFVPLKHFERSCGRRRTVVSLQKGAGSEQLPPLADQWKIIDLGNPIGRRPWRVHGQPLP